MYAADPVRLVYWYVPCGIRMEHWVPNATGTGYDLPRILQQEVVDEEEGVRAIIEVEVRPERDGGGTATSFRPEAQSCTRVRAPSTMSSSEGGPASGRGPGMISTTSLVSSHWLWSLAKAERSGVFRGRALAG